MNCEYDDDFLALKKIGLNKIMYGKKKITEIIKSIHYPHPRTHTAFTIWYRKKYVMTKLIYIQYTYMYVCLFVCFVYIVK